MVAESPAIYGSADLTRRDDGGREQVRVGGQVRLAVTRRVDRAAQPDGSARWADCGGQARTRNPSDSSVHRRSRPPRCVVPMPRAGTCCSSTALLHRGRAHDAQTVIEQREAARVCVRTRAIPSWTSRLSAAPRGPTFCAWTRLNWCSATVRRRRARTGDVPRGGPLGDPCALPVLARALCRRGCGTSAKSAGPMTGDADIRSRLRQAARVAVGLRAIGLER